MKIKKSKILALILTLALIVSSLAACASGKKSAIKIEDTKISSNMVQLFLSRMKGVLCSTYGKEALSDGFWDTVMSADGETYNNHFTKQVIDNAKTYAAALYLFDANNLKLPDSYIDEIDKEIDRLIEEDGKGSKNTLNSILAEFGVNYKMLREAYIIDAKISYLNDYLFGKDGSKISPNLVEDYYRANYGRFKQVFIYTYTTVYETDTDGNDIYYRSDDGKKISYDKTATLKKDAEGNIIKDKNGDAVYVDKDGKIAYNKKDGKRNPVLGEDGYPVTRKYTEKEMIAAMDRATMVEEKAENKNYALFDTLVKNYSEDGGMEEYPNGYYITKDSDYDSKEVVKAVFEMKDGEVRRVYSDYGIHIVMKYELDEGAYAKKENSDFFVGKESGKFVFMNRLKESLMADYLKQYKDMVVIDENVLKGIDMKSVGANFYY